MPSPQDLRPKTNNQIGKNSPQKTPFFSRNSPPHPRKITEKPQNPLVKPEGTNPQSPKNAQNQAFFAVTGFRHDGKSARIPTANGLQSPFFTQSSTDRDRWHTKQRQKS
jgi:hypothetical protein